MLGTAGLLIAARGIRVSKLFSALILFNLVSLVLSTAVSTRPGLSLIGTGWREFGLVPHAAALLFAWLIAGNADARRPVLRGVAISGLIAGAYGIAQYFGWDPVLPAAAYHIGEGIWTIVRPPGTMGYVSYFAAWLAMAAILCAALARMEALPVWRNLAWAAAAVCAFAMALTGTRAAMVGLAAGCAVWLWLSGWRVSRRAVAIAAAIVTVAAVFYFSPAGWNLRSRARWFAEDPTGGGRPLLWRDTLRMAAARPLAGYGPETFTAQFTRLESPELASKLPDFEYESPHNMFLDALAAQGAVGLIALAALCGASLMAGFRAREAGLTAALAAGIVTQQFSVMTAPTALLLYTICGLLMIRHEPRTGPMRILPLVFAIVLAAFGVRLLATDHWLAQAQDRLKEGDSAGAASHYARYQRWLLPGEMAADLWYSRAALGLAQQTSNPAVRLQAVVQAQAAAARATQTADDPFNAWYNLAAFDAMRGDNTAAERSLRRAIAARPNWFKPHWTLARLLWLESRPTEARAEAEHAVGLDHGKDPEVTLTLAEIRGQLQK